MNNVSKLISEKASIRVLGTKPKSVYVVKVVKSTNGSKKRLYGASSYSNPWTFLLNSLYSLIVAIMATIKE